MTTRPKHSRRRAYTLIELLAVIAMLGAIVILTAMLMQRLMQTEHGALRDVVLDRTLIELSVQFRGDAHEATKAERIGEGELRFTGAKHEIHYAVAAGGVERRQLAAQGQVQRTERFNLAQCQIVFGESQDESRSWATLSIRRPAPMLGGSTPKPTGSAPLEVRAVIGRVGASLASVKE